MIINPHRYVGPWKEETRVAYKRNGGFPTWDRMALQQ
jgi:hypothetical protein